MAEDDFPGFLLRDSSPGTEFFILQGNGGKIIINTGPVGGGGTDPGISKATQMGVSAVKKQYIDREVIFAQGTALGTVIIRNLYNFSGSKIIFPLDGPALAPAPITAPSQLEATSPIILYRKGIIKAQIILPRTEIANHSKIVRKLEAKSAAVVGINPLVQAAKTIEKYHNLKDIRDTKRNKLKKIVGIYEALLSKDIQKMMRSVLPHKKEEDNTMQIRNPTQAALSNDPSLITPEEDKQKILRQLKKNKLKKLISAYELLLTEDVRKTPTIQVSVNEPVHRRGDLMRITTNMDEKTGNIYMRIIDNNGVIVQKAGLVKKNATGFQILVGTRDLKAGKYFIQVSNHDSFSPLGVAEFNVQGISPVPLALAIIPGLLTPDSPDVKFEFEIYRTMMDSRVDAACKVFENKIYRSGQGPMPPIHFNCRCFREGIEQSEKN